MAMTDEEILSAAARLRAARRRRVAKTCEVCGTPFEGVAQRRYCSDACRMRASRQRREMQGAPAPRLASATMPSLIRLDRGRDRVDEGDFDSTEDLRHSREERTTELLRASGMIPEEPPPPAPRGEGEPLMDYIERVSAYVMGGQTFDDDSARLIRHGRLERTAELLRAIGGESAEG
jgi:predicted nucleic acid-binding Zn ribbon protein